MSALAALMAMMAAQQQPASTITLTANLPAYASIDQPYSGSVTATLVNGATGPVTIILTGIPAGWIGATVDHGDGTYTVAVNGTPDAASTLDWTADASNGTLNATQASGSIVVCAAGAFAIVEMVSKPWTTADGVSLPFVHATEPGDTVIVALSTTGSATSYAVTDTNGAPYTSPAFKNGINAVTAGVYVSQAQPAGSAFRITVRPSGGSSGTATAYLLRGAPLTVDTANVLVGATGGGAVAAGTTYSMGPFKTSGRAFVVGVVATYQNGGPTAPFTVSPDTPLELDGSRLNGSHSELFGHARVDAAVSGQPFKVVASTTGTSANVTWALVPFLY